MSSQAIDKQVQEFFAHADDNIIAVYLFGSQARGTAKATSDVDLGLLYRIAPTRYDELPLTLEGDLERLLKKPVQTVVLNRAPCDLVHRVLRDGKLLRDADPAERIRFEIQARNEYFDLLPTLSRYRRGVAA